MAASAETPWESLSPEEQGFLLGMTVLGTGEACLAQLEPTSAERCGSAWQALRAAPREERAGVVAAIARKPERHEFREKPEQVLRFMSVTGG